MSNDSELIAIFDIGSGSVGAALVLMPKEEGGKPQFLAVSRYPVLFAPELKAEKFLKNTIEAVKQASKDIAKAVPQKVFCYLAAPWSAHQTRLIDFAGTTPLVSRRQVTELVAKETKRFHEGIKDYPESRLIENKILSLLEKKKEKNAPTERTLALFLSFSQSKVLGNLKETIRDSLKVREGDIEFSSFLSAFFNTTRSYFDPRNFVLLDVGGEVTELALVRDNILIESMSFPLGKNSLIRRLNSFMSGSAPTLLSLYFDNRLEESARKKIKKILSEEGDHWQKHLILSLKNTRSKQEPIFLTVDNEAAKFYSDSLSTLTKSPIGCIFLEAKALMEFCRFSQNVIPDPFLMIEALSLQVHEV